MAELTIDVSNDAYIARTAICEAAAQYTRPSVLFRPTLSVDGNMYCALYGEDLAEGVAGFGETAEAAMMDFDKNWYHSKSPQMRRALKQCDCCGRVAELTRCEVHGIETFACDKCLGN